MAALTQRAQAAVPELRQGQQLQASELVEHVESSYLRERVKHKELRTVVAHTGASPAAEAYPKQKVVAAPSAAQVHSMLGAAVVAALQ